MQSAAGLTFLVQFTNLKLRRWLLSLFIKLGTKDTSLSVYSALQRQPKNVKTKTDYVFLPCFLNIFDFFNVWNNHCGTYFCRYISSGLYVNRSTIFLTTISADSAFKRRYNLLFYKLRQKRYRKVVPVFRG